MTRIDDIGEIDKRIKRPRYREKHAEWFFMGTMPDHSPRNDGNENRNKSHGKEKITTKYRFSIYYTL